MTKVRSIAAIVLLGVAGTATAQDSVPAQDRWAQVAACATARSNEARHACVDGVMRAAGVLDAVTEAAINRENFGRETPAPLAVTSPAPPAPAVATAPRPGAGEAPSAVVAPAPAPQPAAAPAPINGIVTRVASARLGGDRHLLVTTAEGAVWRQADSDVIRRLPREGEVFEVREGSLGSYRCTFNGTTTFRCNRRD